MQWYKADLHVHTVLSPCGDTDMSPSRIIERAKDIRLQLLGVTDHNSTKHCRVMMELGDKFGITVIPGAEITTQEEIHCLAFFENARVAALFQQFIDKYLIPVRNKPDRFGHQFVVDEMENVLEEEERLLITALDAGIEEVEQQVHALDGIFIPAHIDRSSNSLLSQLGFIPDSVEIDGLEISKLATADSGIHGIRQVKDYTVIRNSDAHYLHQIGTNACSYYLEKPVYSEFRMALRGENGRKVKMA